MTSLYVGLVLLVVVAACGVVPLRRYQDRRWEQHVALERLRAHRVEIDLTPQMQRLAADYQRAAEQIREAMLPTMQQMTVTMTRFAEAFGPVVETYRSLPWWRRVWLRIRMRFTR